MLGIHKLKVFFSTLYIEKTTKNLEIIVDVQ